MRPLVEERKREYATRAATRIRSAPFLRLRFVVVRGLFAALPFVVLAVACSGSSAPGDDADGSGPLGGENDAGSSDAHVAEDAAAPNDAAIAEADASLDVDGGTWSDVSFGVTTKDVPGGRDDVAIAYGGYTATDAESQAWVIALAGSMLAARGVGHLYAVRGPKDADYSSREIGNSTLATALAARTSAKSIVVVAHSSGGFVADELWTFASDATLAKVTYFDLDGGSWSLTSALVAKMRGVYTVGADDPVAGKSENYSSDESLHTKLAGSHFYSVDASGSGCNTGAGWCLHDTLINSKPHDPAFYDLADDYVDFGGGRHVVTSYLTQAVIDGTL